MPYGISIAEGTARTVWMCGDSASTYYIGQLVGWNASAGAQCIGAVVPLPAANGLADATGEVVVAGVVVGFDDLNPTFDATYGLQKSVMACTTQAHVVARRTAGVYAGGRGMYGINDKQPLIEVALIDSTTVLKAPICETAGTAPRVLTLTAADTDGGVTALTHNASAFTPVPNGYSDYCRKGLNAGQWRVGKGTATTAHEFTVAFEYDFSIGDTLVGISLKQGISHIKFGATPLSTFIDNTLSGGTSHSFACHVLYIDAKVAGKEYATFRIDGIHFCQARA
jgi:hypothetical protein